MKSKASFIAASERTSQKLNITSLMDVLTIILVFLLVNYSSVEQEMQIPDYVRLPEVTSKTLENLNHTLKVVLGKDRIAINEGKEIQFKSFSEQQGQILENLAESMAKIKQDNDLNKAPSILAIQADKDIPYEYIDGVILSAASVGITQIELISFKKQD
jgi:biopolymer transport protein ExbD